MIQIKGMKACNPAQDPMCGWNMRHTGDDNISFDALGPCLASFLSLEGEKGLILRKCITALQASCDLQRTFEMVAILLLGIQVGFRSVTHVPGIKCYSGS